jgi:translation initiation factor 2 alpha subunit (eIF-2alpha)
MISDSSNIETEVVDATVDEKYDEEYGALTEVFEQLVTEMNVIFAMREPSKEESIELLNKYIDKIKELQLSR